MGDVTIQPEPLGVITQGGLLLSRKTTEQSQGTQHDTRDQPETVVGALGGRFLQGLSIPFACIGSGDPVRVLRLYTTNTLDIL